MSTASKGLTFAGLEPRTDATAQLVVLLAKSSLSSAQISAVRELCADIEDWNAFIDIAYRKFSSSYSSKHLKAHAADIVPDDVLSTLAALANRNALATLRVLGAQARFHHKCILTTEPDYAYVKGPALAKQCGLSFSDRFSRDIDVLVSERDLARVLEAARDAGFLFRLDDAQPPTVPTAKDLHFLARYADVITVFEPEGVPVEIHRRLDKMSLDFTFEKAKKLGGLSTVELPGMKVTTLAPTLHFVYSCYHHSRHFWSKLHWLADIEAFRRSPDFDPEKAKSIALEIGILPSIEAALEFDDLTKDPSVWTTATLNQTAGGQFLKACLINLDGDLDLEQTLREDMKLNDFMSAWQVSSGRYSGLWRQSWLRRLRPSVTQYTENPYPRGWYWLYSVKNGVQLAKNGLALAFGSRPQTPSQDHDASADSNR